MVMVLLGAGLRSAELTALECRDIREDLSPDPVLRIRGKRGRERLVPIRPSVLPPPMDIWPAPAVVLRRLDQYSSPTIELLG
jgi:integrase